jgi:hypothetical protein
MTSSSDIVKEQAPSASEAPTSSVKESHAEVIADERSKKPLPEETSPSADGNGTVTSEDMRVVEMPMKQTSQTQPRPAIRRQPSPPSNNALVCKFSYEPRADESAYYQGLFNYVASFLNNTKEKKQSEGGVILPPKLVAEKLFLASKIPSEKLRVIWNMATAVMKPVERDECSAGGAAAEEVASVADSYKPVGEGNPISNSITSGADSHVSKSSSKTGGEGGRDGGGSCGASINSKGTLVVMTKPQFNTTVRLIQLFQNKTSALDAQLKKVDKSKLNSKGKGAFMQGKLVTFDEDGLLPAYFAGITGVILAIPGSMEYKLNGDISIVSTKGKSALPNRRRTVDADAGSAKASMSGMRRRTVTGEMENKGTNEVRLKQIESEILQLKTTVQSLQTELNHLKALIPKRAGNMNMTRTISHPAMASGANLNNGVHHRPNSGDVRKAAPIDTSKANTIANRTVASETAKDSGNKATIRNEKQESAEDDSPNTGVESFWGQKEETPDSQYPIKLAPSLQNKLKVMSKQAKERLAVREVASFDPKVPPNVSSNIPAMHPSARKQPIRVQPKIHAAPQTRGPPQASSTDLRQSASTSGSNGSVDVMNKLRSSAGSNGQTFPVMISSQSGDFNGAVSNLRSSVGKAGQPSSSTGTKMSPKEDFNASLTSLRSSASTSRQTSAPKSILKGRKLSPPASGSSLPQPMRTDQQQLIYIPKRKDPSRLSLYSEATAPMSNAVKNLRQTNVTNADINPRKTSPKVDDESSARRPAAKSSRRLTKNALTESIRHIVRNKDGTIQVYQEKDAPPSTNAMDVQPLQPAPMTASSILQNFENGSKPKKKSSVLMRRLSSG